MKTRHLILILACLVFASCEEFLDVKPKGEVIPETTDHFEAMLNGTVQGSFCHMQDYQSDDALLPFGYPPGPSAAPFNLYDAVGPQSQGNPMRKLYQFNPVPFTEVDNDMMWTQGHYRLLYFNSVIEYVMDSKEGTDAKKRSLRAEALVQRAIEFYSMVNIYAQQYDPATAATEPGIPMFLHPDATTSVPRSTVKEVYDRILSEVKEALPDLPETPVLGRYRASYPGAIAFLARVYLTMGDYKTALEYADEALGYNNVLVDLNGQMANLVLRQGPPDVIPFYGPGAPVGWVTNLDGTPVPDANDHPETILARTFQSPYGLGSGANVLMSVELGNLFDKANDKRYELWYGNWPPSPYANLEGEFGVKAYLRGDQFNIGPGTGEMYLIRAECNARSGQLQNALNDVNHLRKNRYATGTHIDKTLADFNNDDFKVLKFVLEERRRELAFRGFRVTDLKRLNKDPRFAKTITHETPEGTFTLEPNSYKYLRQLFPGSTKYHPDWQLNPVD